MLKVIIPCFPRSGSSFLAGLIVRMGFNPGPEKWLKKSDELNPFGYYECIPLLKISRGILKKFGGDILKNIPNLPNGWLDELETEKKQILDIVCSGKVEIFKDASMLIIADLYNELFPRVKWIAIHREVKETFKSRFGVPLTYEEWEKITGTRLRKWQQTKPFSRALNLDYKDFFLDCRGTIEKISTFLGIQLTSQQIIECMDFFKPGQRKNIKYKRTNMKHDT
jgi:hypothetical protein